jgi:hypothetical protein
MLDTSLSVFCYEDGGRRWEEKRQSRLRHGKPLPYLSTADFSEAAGKKGTLIGLNI